MPGTDRSALSCQEGAGRRQISLIGRDQKAGEQDCMLSLHHPEMFKTSFALHTDLRAH